MTRVTAAVLIGLAVLGAAAADDRKPRAEAVSKRFFRSWLCVEEVAGEQ